MEPTNKTPETATLEAALTAEYNRGYQDGLERAIEIYQASLNSPIAAPQEPNTVEPIVEPT